MRGFKDNLPPISYKLEFIRKTFSEFSFNYSVDLIELPIVEEADLYFRTSGEESDVCNKELFEVRKYKGDFEDWVLRPEGTASCVRAVKEASYLERNKVCRLGYYGPMFRYNRPQKGRYRQFFQGGWEWFGSNSQNTDLEILLAADDLLKSLGLKCVLEINSIGNAEDRNNYRAILRKYFDIEKDPFKHLDKLDVFEEIPKMELNEFDHNSFEFIKEQLKVHNRDFIHNPYLVRGLDYYNGIVFEFKYQGQTILAGGRYDGLLAQLGGRSVPAIGFGLGVDRAADYIDFEPNIEKKVALINLGVSEYAFKIANDLRRNSYNVLPLWDMELAKALKFASQSHKYVVIVGEKEANSGTFILKDLETSVQKEFLNTDFSFC